MRTLPTTRTVLSAVTTYSQPAIRARNFIERNNTAQHPGMSAVMNEQNCEGTGTATSHSASPASQCSSHVLRFNYSHFSLLTPLHSNPHLSHSTTSSQISEDISSLQECEKKRSGCGVQHFPFYQTCKDVTCNEGGRAGKADVMPGQKLSLSLRLLHFQLLQTPQPSLQYQDFGSAIC